jgi:Asp-tRNA(Asn)/Glu-tRNA(Gln) amidotransferase C subunit
MLYYYAVGEIAGYHKFSVLKILKNIVVGDHEEAVDTRDKIEDFIRTISTLERSDSEGFDPTCFELLLHVRTELLKIRELSEEEMKEFETGVDPNFAAKKGMSKARQDEILQGWTARGQRRAHGGKKSKKQRKNINKSKRKTLK